MTTPVLGRWRRLGLSPRFYAILLVALAGVVGVVYLGLSLGNPEMAEIMTGLLLDLAPAVLAVTVIGVAGKWVISKVLGR